MKKQYHSDILDKWFPITQETSWLLPQHQMAYLMGKRLRELEKQNGS